MTIICETPRLLLKQYTLDDVALLHPITSDTETMSFYPEFFSLEKVTVWIERSLQCYEEFGFGRYGVLLKDTRAFIGCAGFFRTSVNNVMENDLGYIIAKKHWGKGYATEVAQACIDMVRENAWFHRIVIQMADEHTASRRVAERLGAKLGTTFINHRNREKLTNLFVMEI